MKGKRYLVFCDDRFLEQAIEELRKADPKAKFENTGVLTRKNPIVVQSESDILNSEYVFIDAILPIIIEIKDYKGDLTDVIDTLAGSLGKRNSFKLEVVRINSKLNTNAKSVEVMIGSALESKGFTVDLKNPEVMIYLLLTSNRAIAAEGSGATPFVADRFRQIVNRKEEKVSRSEFKLEEAFRYFELRIKKGEKVLDAGAAPGGWTNYMLKQGAFVVAVDNAELDKKMSPKGVVHIRQRIQNVDRKMLSEHGKYDFLLMDMNINPSESAKLAVGFSDILNNGAHLILTIKLVDARIDKHISDVKRILSEKYDGIRMKKLPHNREEVTCIAMKK